MKVWRAAAAALAMALTLAGCMSQNEDKRFPTSKDFPPGVMARVALPAGGGFAWTLSALETPKRAAPWKIAVVTGTPSWSEFWAPTLAKAPKGREMIVADRPGFSLSEPETAVTRIADQAGALTALLAGPADQKVVLIGQSYGGPVSALLAAQNPEKVRALVLMSAFFGEQGPTARRLVALGAVARPLLPRDLKNALDEVRGQAPQLAAAREALKSLSIPVIILHGDKDSFVALSAAQAQAEETGATLIVAPGGDHFLNACCVDAILNAVETAIEMHEARQAPPLEVHTARQAPPLR
jgi:pimeloyl-ACP methyl ester carboxylesterase